MSIESRKEASAGRVALAPQRSNGRERVSEILETAAKVIQERGFDATTMKEIAERSRTKTGSLYRFFPSKEIIAEALIERYSRLVDAEFDRIDAIAKSGTIHQLADQLIDFLVTIRNETGGLTALLDSRVDGFVKRKELRDKTLRRLAKIVRYRVPNLEQKAVTDIAVVLLHAMKTMVAVSLDPTAATSPGAPAELRIMNRLYLEDRLCVSKASPKKTLSKTGKH